MILKLKRTPGIYLIGFMASGKTTIGRLLADELGWSFADLDQDIEGAQGSSIAQIFDTRSEAEFRTVEKEAVRRRVGEVERGYASKCNETSDPLVHKVQTPAQAAQYLASRLACARTN